MDDPLAMQILKSQYELSCVEDRQVQRQSLFIVFLNEFCKGASLCILVNKVQVFVILIFIIRKNLLKVWDKAWQHSDDRDS